METHGFQYKYGDAVQKKTRGGKGAQFRGHIVGFYQSSLTLEGYAIESAFEKGTVQIYPLKMIEPWTPKDPNS